MKLSSWHWMKSKPKCSSYNRTNSSITTPAIINIRVACEPDIPNVRKMAMSLFFCHLHHHQIKYWTPLHGNYHRKNNKTSQHFPAESLYRNSHFPESSLWLAKTTEFFFNLIGYFGAFIKSVVLMRIPSIPPSVFSRFWASFKWIKANLHHIHKHPFQKFQQR